MNRRKFLGLGGGAAASILGGLSLPACAVSSTQSTVQPTAVQTAVEQATAVQPTAVQQTAELGRNRTLLVVDLQGGNDALNTFVPQSGLYRDLRPTLALPEADLLAFRGLDYGVHPALASLQPFWDGGQMAALYGTGIEGQGRSHFVAQDAWRTARPGEPARSGWLGRWLETAPAGSVPLQAIALGQSTLAAQGEQGRPVAIQSVSGFQLKPPNDNADVTAAFLAMGSPLEAGWIGEAQAAIPQTVDAVTQLQGLVAGVEINESADIDLEGDASLFQAAQAIIQGDVGTKVLYLTISGFDTHSLQTAKQDALLRLVADGLSSMFAALEESGHAETTLALVVSEFGRRAAENGSSGTDHGKGGLSFLLGSPVTESTVIGEPDLADLLDGDLRITIDARSMYDNALRWLGASDEVVSEVLGGEWSDLSLLSY